MKQKNPIWPCYTRQSSLRETCPAILLRKWFKNCDETQSAQNDSLAESSSSIRREKKPFLRILSVLHSKFNFYFTPLLIFFHILIYECVIFRIVAKVVIHVQGASKVRSDFFFAKNSLIIKNTVFKT